MGYKKKRSKDSLVASSIIAGLLLFSAYLMGKPNTTYGIRLALGGPCLVASAVALQLLYCYYSIMYATRIAYLSVRVQLCIRCFVGDES